MHWLTGETEAQRGQTTEGRQAPLARAETLPSPPLASQKAEAWGGRSWAAAMTALCLGPLKGDPADVLPSGLAQSKGLEKVVHL